ncbi:kelch-like protein 5 [Episyrphus balteatus]|uniref:kelch-like protein 5 n=1 Tax=Episyrphus balteatus TaxID=286459 RepID=UPI0024867ADB|nr:kelch-like protein 5 [Episyrphus balteatus]
MSSVFLENFFKQIHNFSKDNLFCDVTLISSDDQCKINAHKVVLAGASKYFLAMFGGSFRESNEKEVKLQIDSQSLKLVINYIYTATIGLSTYEVVEILKTAHLFELETLKNECCDFMGRHLSISNCLEIASLADHYNLNNLYEISENYICDNFKEVRNNDDDEFLNLNCDILNKLISSNKLQLESEEEVFNCIQSWVDHDPANRTIDYDRLLQNVRLPLIDPIFISNVIQKACKSMKCKMLINKTLQWHLLPELRPVLFSEKLTQPRYSKYTLLAISGWASEDNQDLLSVGEFSFRTNKWSYTTWPAPPTELRHFSANFEYVLFKNSLVLAGGYDNNENPSNKIIYFNLNSKTWKQTYRMNRMRTNFVSSLGQICFTWLLFRILYNG